MAKRRVAARDIPIFQPRRVRIAKIAGRGHGPGLRSSHAGCQMGRKERGKKQVFQDKAEFSSHGPCLA